MAENTASILPGNLPELEHQLEALEQRLTDLEIPIEQLWNPATCPVIALPYLAWAVSVDVWDPNWPENIKRQVIAAAPELHRIKGTPKAVKQALTALNLDYSYSEWHEQQPIGSPGTFNIDVWVSEQGIDEAFSHNVTQQINSNKRATAHYLLSLNLQGKSNSFKASAIQQSDVVTIQPYMLKEISQAGLFYQGAGMTYSIVQTVGPKQ